MKECVWDYVVSKKHCKACFIFPHILHNAVVVMLVNM